MQKRRTLLFFSLTILIFLAPQFALAVDEEEQQLDGTGLRDAEGKDVSEGMDSIRARRKARSKARAAKREASLKSRHERNERQRIREGRFTPEERAARRRASERRELSMDGRGGPEKRRLPLRPKKPNKNQGETKTSPAKQQAKTPKPAPKRTRSAADESRFKTAREKRERQRMQEGRYTPEERAARRRARERQALTDQSKGRTFEPDNPWVEDRYPRPRSGAAAARNTPSRAQKMREAWNKSKKGLGKGASQAGNATAVMSGMHAERQAAAAEDRETSALNAAKNTAIGVTVGGNYSLGRSVAEQEIREADREGRSRSSAFGRAIGRTAWEKVSGPYKSSKDAYQDEAREEMRAAEREGRAPSGTRVRLRGAARSVGEVTGIAEAAEALEYDDLPERRAVRSGRLLQTKTNAKVEISLHRLWDLQDRFNRELGSGGAVSGNKRGKLQSIAGQYRGEYRATAGKISRLEGKGVIDSGNAEYVALRQAFAALPAELRVPNPTDERELDEFLDDSENELNQALQESERSSDINARGVSSRVRGVAAETGELQRRTRSGLEQSRRQAGALRDDLGRRVGSEAARDARDAWREQRGSRNPGTSNGTNWDEVNQRVRGGRPRSSGAGNTRTGGRRATFTPPGSPLPPVSGSNSSRTPTPGTSSQTGSRSSGPIRCPEGFRPVGDDCVGRAPGDLGTSTVDSISE